MKNEWVHAITVFMAFFAIMNPIANVPIFISLTQGDDDETVRAVAFRALALAFGIVVLFATGGQRILEIFGISLPAFRITGGLLVFLIGFHMLQGKHSRVQQPTDEVKQLSREAALSVAVAPLGMPILAGPGTIATAMSFASKGGTGDILLVIGAFGTLCVITYLLFLFGEKFVTYIGAGALGVITRMMGLIISVIGVQMLIEGVRGAFGLPLPHP